MIGLTRCKLCDIPIDPNHKRMDDETDFLDAKRYQRLVSRLTLLSPDHTLPMLSMLLANLYMPPPDLIWRLRNNYDTSEVAQKKASNMLEEVTFM